MQHTCDTHVLKIQSFGKIVIEYEDIVTHSRTTITLGECADARGTTSNQSPPTTSTIVPATPLRQASPHTPPSAQPQDLHDDPDRYLLSTNGPRYHPRTGVLLFTSEEEENDSDVSYDSQSGLPTGRLHFS